MDKNICIFGASSTWGAWDSEKGGWVNRLRLDLESNSKDYIELYNLGVNGNTVVDLLKRFETEAKARNPDILIFSIGDNDSALLSLKEFEQNLIKLVNLAKKFTKKIVFLGFKPIDESKTNPVEWDKTVSYTNEKMQEYHNKLKEIVEKQGLGYIEMSNVLNINQDLEDGLHPNAKGHQKIYKAVKAFLIKEKLI